MLDGLSQLSGMLVRLALAFLLALPVGWEREHRSHSHGIRTFPLVALGSCAFFLMGEHLFAGDKSAMAYVFQAVLGGIGFIGGGAIIKSKGEVRGLATAVSLWITAGIGAAAAFRLYGLAAALSVVTVITLQWMRVFKPSSGEE